MHMMSQYVRGRTKKIADVEDKYSGLDDTMEEKSVQRLYKHVKRTT